MPTSRYSCVRRHNLANPSPPSCGLTFKCPQHIFFSSGSFIWDKKNPSWGSFELEAAFECSESGRQWSEDGRGMRWMWKKKDGKGGGGGGVLGEQWGRVGGRLNRRSVLNHLSPSLPGCNVKTHIYHSVSVTLLFPPHTAAV